MGRSNYRETLSARLAKLRDTMDRRARGEDIDLFIRTGLRDWDANGGIERGILTVIGAATGDGKSLVKLHLATVAARAGLRVLMLDFEDPGAKTADRSFSTITGINSRLIGTLAIDEWDYERLEVALAGAEWAERIEHHTGLIDSDVCLALMDGAWDLILVDYAQCFPEAEGKNMEGTIRAFSLAANMLAQKHNAAVIIFSQVKAEVEARGFRAYDRSKFRDASSVDVSEFCPKGLTDIAWAKAMGDQAKCLLYIWRPNRMKKKLTGSAKIKDDELWIIAGKANFAEENDLKFHYDGATATIRDKDP